MLNEENQKYKAEFEDLRFRNEIEFKKWLDKTATHKIEFEDIGQDCLEWWIDDGGEVLHSRMQPSIWNGHLVDLHKLVIGREIGLLDVKNQSPQFYDFRIKTIIKLEREVNKNG